MRTGNHGLNTCENTDLLAPDGDGGDKEMRSGVYHPANTNVFEDSVLEVAVTEETIALFHTSAASKSTRGPWELKFGGGVTPNAEAKSAAPAGVVKLDTGRPHGSGRGSRGGPASFIFSIGRRRDHNCGGNGGRELGEKKVDRDSSCGGGESGSKSNRDDGDNYNDEDEGVKLNLGHHESIAARDTNRFNDTFVVSAGLSGCDNAKNEKIATKKQKKKDDIEQELVSLKLTHIKKQRGTNASSTKIAPSLRESMAFSSAKVSPNSYSKFDV
ncbi:hypothetical protein HK100_004925 [Physocladia obscura]|uniref:Uncharacterized protein n=1 Tax=Physocladia obscura TaxID=109957 RepID=A0AAD5XGK7_9FUNG|nr:hypothetical protein HK100_004925 [Physocladia obscura]